MDRRVTSPTRGPPSPCSQALSNIRGGGRRFLKRESVECKQGICGDSQRNPLVTAGE